MALGRLLTSLARDRRTDGAWAGRRDQAVEDEEVPVLSRGAPLVDVAAGRLQRVVAVSGAKEDLDDYTALLP